jgi:hypothetical protein
MKYTRKEYMSGDCSHREYYDQFVDSNVRQDVADFIGVENILKSKDKYFNDIALSNWDMMAPVMRMLCGKSVARANGSGGVSLSDMVCVAKAAARQIKESKAK